MPPAHLIAAWSAERNFLDIQNRHNGRPIAEVVFGTGMVGFGFQFDGQFDAVHIEDAPELRLQNFTIEAWIRRADQTLVSQDGGDAGIFEGSFLAYAFGIRAPGRLLLSKVGVSEVLSSVTISDTSFHHVAVTRNGDVVVFYVDGIPERVPQAYGDQFSFGPPFAIGSRGGDYAGSFWGTIDELAIYSRALSESEIQSIFHAREFGRCSLPRIVTQPASQVGYWGSTIVLQVVAMESGPTQYQWFKDGLVVEGQTNATLVLTNVQTAAAGTYTVVVGNLLGSIVSAPAYVTINPAGVSLDIHAIVRIEGNAGSTYGIQASTNLSDPANWRGITNITLEQPNDIWMDPTPATRVRRFYRVLPEPVPIP
jgi:hypothetical protein